MNKSADNPNNITNDKITMDTPESIDNKITESIPLRQKKYYTPAYIKPQDLLSHFELYSRLPFQQELAKLLSCAPDLETIEKFARKSPDRYYQACVMLARLAGYNETVEIQGDIRQILALKTLSDYEINERIKDLENQRVMKEKDNSNSIDITPNEGSQG